jgi:ubiquinone/menaquinone biosynthesis C-methylase UbiE
MARVNYSDIAARYDQNPIRSNIAPDQILDLAAGKPWSVLDLGCGTGTYLELHARLPKHKNVQWYGADPSEEMLSIAMGKVPRAKFHKAMAEKLPFPDAHFDYVTSRFSFHHFTDRYAAIKEIHRVVKPNGFFKIVNLAPELSPNWWIFKYFPEAKQIDAKRFWDLEFLKNEMLKSGFKIHSSHLKMRDKIKASLILNEARNRETSELLLVSDNDFAAGLRHLEKDLADQPDQDVTWGLMIAELAFIKN